MGRLTFILGGVRSGKSQLAQERAAGLGGEVLFVATGEALDEEMGQRIAEHRRTRPAEWRTIEAPVNVGRAIREHAGGARVVVLDCVTLLVSNVIGRCGSPDLLDPGLASGRVAAEIEGLVSCVDSAAFELILVSNEVGLGLVPDNRLGRLYRDLLGRANRDLARRADAVYFMVAGIPVVVKGDR